MKQDDLIKLELLSYASGGDTVGKTGNYTVFVKGGIVGESVLCKVTYVKKNIAYATVKEVLRASVHRKEPPCAVFGRCGGCNLMYMDYAEQLNFKRTLVENNLKKIGGIEICVPPVIPSPKKLGYRNKISIPVGTVKGRTAAGFFSEGSHFLVENNGCFLEEKWAKILVDKTLEYMKLSGLKPYNERTGSGEVRHILGRYVEGQLLACLVLNAEREPNLSLLEGMLSKDFEKFGIFVNFNRAKTNVIMGEVTKHICGIEHIDGRAFGVNFQLQADSFYQVNDEVKDEIYSRVKQMLDGAGIDLFVDAFSGIGLLSGALYSEKYDTVAIEIVPSAVEDAERMKERNGLVRLTNICGDVTVELPKVVEKYKGKKVALVVDPPRKGLNESIIKAIVKAKPTQIFYISCDSATLARDLKQLAQQCNEISDYSQNNDINQTEQERKALNGTQNNTAAALSYEIALLQPFDMFPMTTHVETLCCLTLKEATKG